jgi:perosamine synthetase
VIQTAILLSDPDISAAELAAVGAVLQSPRLSGGPVTAAFESAFARYTGRAHAIAVSSGPLAMLLTLKAYGIGPEDEVIASPHSWREAAHAIALCGAAPRFADIDYWAGTLSPQKAASRITPRTRAIIAGNANGHPAPWNEFRELTGRCGLLCLSRTRRRRSVRSTMASAWAASAIARCLISRSLGRSRAAKAG